MPSAPISPESQRPDESAQDERRQNEGSEDREADLTRSARLRLEQDGAAWSRGIVVDDHLVTWPHRIEVGIWRTDHRIGDLVSRSVDLVHSANDRVVLRFSRGDPSGCRSRMASKADELPLSYDQSGDDQDEKQPYQDPRQEPNKPRGPIAVPKVSQSARPLLAARSRSRRAARSRAATRTRTPAPRRCRRR